MSKLMRFDHLWRSVEETYQTLKKCGTDQQRTIKAFRSAAYAFANVLMKIQDKYMSEFLSMITQSGKTLDEWYDDHFAMIEAMGNARRDLMDDIRSGMSMKEYVAQFTSWGVKKRMSSRLTIAKKIARKRIKDKRTDVEKVKDQAAEILRLERTNEVLLERVETLELRLDRAKKRGIA